LIERGREVPIFSVRCAIRRVVALSAVAVLGVGLASCGGDDNSASGQLDRVDTADGIKVTVTTCKAKSLPSEKEGGFDISQTLFSVAGKVENTTDETRVGVRVHVTYLDGDDPFYDETLNEKYSFGGFGEGVEGAKEFSTSSTLSDEVEDFRCEATATS
jgi:hypothetical protein